MEGAGALVSAPVSLPNSTGQTYAILEFVGFSVQSAATGPEKLMPIAARPDAAGARFAIQCKDASLGAPICPPTPPARQLGSSPAQGLDSSGSDTGSCGSEVCKKEGSPTVSKPSRKLGCVKTTTMKRAGGGGGSIAGVPPPLPSPSSAKRQPPSPSGLGAGSTTPQTEREKEQMFASTTTFVQADTSSFRELVQKLTGASDSDAEKFPITLPSRQAVRVVETSGAQKSSDNTFGGLIPKPVGDLGARRPSFKLHERRQSNIRKLDVKGLGAAAAFTRGVAGYAGVPSPPSGERLSPINQKCPSVLPSPVTPLTMDVFEKSYAPTTPTSYEAYVSAKHSPQPSDEGRAKDVTFFLHPSPTFERQRQPQLLTLFPLTSPRASETS